MPRVTGPSNPSDPQASLTREPQYQIQVELRERKGLASLGLVTNQLWHDDPRHLVFLLSRYKFVAKMLSGKNKVLEVGCGDAFGTRLVLQEVTEILAVDFDPVFVQDVNQRMGDNWKFRCIAHDFVEAPLAEKFEAAYAVDVLEHIPRANEDRFLSNVCRCLTDQGVLVVGMPSLQSQAHASPASREGHVNCKDHRDLKQLVQKYFHNVFLFSMNDEVVHTGFYPMAQYLWAIGVGKLPERLTDRSA